MYGNQIVNGLKRSLKNRTRDWKTPQYRNQVNAAIQIIRQAPHYYLGSYSMFEERLKDELGGQKLFKGNLADVIMPFSEIVVLFHLSNECRFGVIVKQYSNDILTIQTIMSGENEWKLFPISRMYSIGKSLDDAGFFEDAPEKKDEAHKDSNLAVATSVPATLSDDYVFGDGPGKNLMETGCGVANYLLIVLGYKNIISETVVKEKPSPMKKKKVNPLYEYKILKLKPIGKSKKYGYIQPLIDSKGLVPFSRVPAHKKTYTEEGGGMWGNPKLIGTWIIPSYVKGSKQSGFITRDYDVTERV